MNSNEWPLVFFTVISQMTAGIMFISLLLPLVVRNSEMLSGNDFRKGCFFVSLVFMIIALAVSFLHLASPLKSVYALGNLGTSWLSREILVMSLFAFLTAVCFFSARFGIPGVAGLHFWHSAAAISGIILVWVMGRLYMIPLTPVWDNPSTMVAFFTSTFLLGGTALVAIALFTGSKSFPVEVIKPVLWPLIAVTFIAVMVKLLNMFLLVPEISVAGAGLPPPEIPFSWQVFHILFLVLGFFMLIFWANFQMQHPVVYRPQLAYFSFILFFVSEIFGRAVFYASYYRVGV